MKPDQRIPVYWRGSPTPNDAILAEVGQQAPQNAFVVWFECASLGHQLGCGCCITRSPAATALAALFRARATGSAPFFQKVVVLASPDGWAQVTAALTHDVVTHARFKLANTA